MKAPDIYMLCLAAVIAALAAQARPLHDDAATSSSNVARVKSIVTNTAPSLLSPRDAVASTRSSPLSTARHQGSSDRTSVEKFPLHPTLPDATSDRTSIESRPSHAVVPDETRSPLATEASKPSSRNYAVSARVLVSGEAACKRSSKGGNPGLADLAGAETNVVDYLEDRDYRLVKSDRGLVSQNDSYQLGFDGTSSVLVKPLYETDSKIRTEITWRVSGQADWTTKIFVHRGRSLMIGGPKIECGGIYLLSLTIK